jgi:hypothetical protein
VKTPFLGQAYQARSRNLAYSQAVNLFPVMVDDKSGKTPGAFYAAPGLDFLVTVGSGPIRGLKVNQDGSKLLVVSGGTAYAVNSGFAPIAIGNIATPTAPVSIISNDTQTALFDGTAGYLVTTVLTPIALPFAGPVNAIYQDGFGLVQEDGTNNVFQSALGDLTSWPALNFGVANAQSDLIRGLADIHREMWIIKQNNVEVWINAGLPGFAFQRLDGVFTETGCLARNSIAKVGESLLWLAQSAEGQAVIVMTDGYRAARVSTDAIDFQINSYGSLSDAIAYAYAQEGHRFYVISFPGGNASWAYDVDMRAWHQRAALLNGNFQRHWGQVAAHFQGKVIIGDYRNGNLYAYSLNQQLDNGVQRKWVRSWRALPEGQNAPVRFPDLSIDMQTGLGVPPAPDSTVWTHVQGAAAGLLAGPVSTISVTMPGAIQNGNLIALALTWDTSTGATLTSVTDDKGNIYSAQVDNVQDLVHAQQLSTIFRSNTPGAPTVITALLSANASQLGMIVDEFAIASQDAPLNGHAGALVNNPGLGAGAISSGAVNATGQGLCLVYGAVMVAGVGGASTSPGPGFTPGATTGGSNALSGAYKTVQAPAATAATFTTNINDTGFLVSGMVFNPIPLPAFTADPQLMLRWSDDGGHNWTSERYAPAGKTGETARRVYFRRLGSTRKNAGLDRIFELSSTDRFDVALLGANFEED